MGKRLIVIASIILLLIVGTVWYYQSKIKSSQAFAVRLMNVVVPYAEFSDETLSVAANQIWAETVSIDPFFSDKQLVIDLQNPDLYKIKDYKLAECPTREWFNYLCQMTDTTYQIFDDVIYITDKGPGHDYRPWLFQVIEEIELWVYLKQMRRGPKNPRDPFAQLSSQRVVRCPQPLIRLITTPARRTDLQSSFSGREKPAMAIL